MASAASATRAIQPKAALKSSKTKRLVIASRPSTIAQPSRAGSSSWRSFSDNRGMSSLHMRKTHSLVMTPQRAVSRGSRNGEQPDESQADRDQHEKRERHGESHPTTDFA